MSHASRSGGGARSARRPAHWSSFGRKAFDRKKMHSHIKRNTHLLCQTCLPKLQSLQAKAKASDQKRCICRRLSTPSETCPKHGSKTRQYRWCGVMQADESLWLQEHLASKKHQVNTDKNILGIQIHSDNCRGKAKSMVWSKTWACSAVRSVE